MDNKENNLELTRESNILQEEKLQDVPDPISSSFVQDDHSESSGAVEDVDVLENNLLNIKQDYNPTPIVTSNVVKKGRRKSEKGQLITDIIDCYSKSNLSPPSSKTLYKKSMDDLRKMLAGAIENGMNTIHNPSKQQIIDELKDDPKYKDVSLADIPIDMASLSLFRFNFTLAKVLEKLVAYCEGDLGFNINGYGDNLQLHKKELLEYYALLYKQYNVEINNYLSPMNCILMINAGAIFSSVKDKNEYLISKEEILNFKSNQ